MNRGSISRVLRGSSAGNTALDLVVESEWLRLVRKLRSPLHFSCRCLAYTQIFGPLLAKSQEKPAGAGRRVVTCERRRGTRYATHPRQPSISAGSRRVVTVSGGSRLRSNPQKLGTH